MKTSAPSPRRTSGATSGWREKIRARRGCRRSKSRLAERPQQLRPALRAGAAVADRAHVLAERPRAATDWPAGVTAARRAVAGGDQARVLFAYPRERHRHPAAAVARAVGAAGHHTVGVDRAAAARGRLA